MPLPAVSRVQALVLKTDSSPQQDDKKTNTQNQDRDAMPHLDFIMQTFYSDNVPLRTWKNER